MVENSFQGWFCFDIEQADILSLAKHCSWLVFSHYYLLVAYKIRLLSIVEYGRVIHEFDPYFNLRAAEYLNQHGAKKFFQWFDYMSWYPLGRPVGTTIYPGMQFTAVAIKRLLDLGGERLSMSLNDLCCFIPAWFGVIASIVTGFIAYECTLDCNCEYTLTGLLWKKKKQKYQESSVEKKNLVNGRQDMFIDYNPAVECGIFAMGMMGMCPAHLMRSIGGGFDNESVAITPMLLTFYFWVRSLRGNDDTSYRYSFLAAISYFYMASCWGGYIFLLNLIGLHAAVLVLLGRFNTKIYMSYSIFYVVGTVLAMQIPVIGWAPLKSLEQVSALAVFLGYQVLQYCECQLKKKNLNKEDAMKFRLKRIIVAGTIGIVFVTYLLPASYFGPLSARVRGVFIEHAKTGNPLVDSVAEHQPADSFAYFRFLQHLCTGGPIGLILVLFNFGDASSFLVTYAIAAYFMSHRMVRLLLLMGPIASILTGIAVGRMVCYILCKVCEMDFVEDERLLQEEQQAAAAAAALTIQKSAAADGRRKKKSHKKKHLAYEQEDNSVIIMVKTVLYFVALTVLVLFSSSYQNYCITLCRSLSNPTIVELRHNQAGRLVKVDDYREAYWWLRDNTPEDSRVLAWWDYGYQITSISNRTTIADGNTWNHEHIALLGRVLTSPEEEGYQIARHLSDYVLVWAGGGGDDLAKSPHLARIANSVYRTVCPNDTTCSGFGFTDLQRTPSKMMGESLLYKLHSHELKPGVQANPAYFEEVYKSKYGKVRIFKVLNIDKESKAWVDDPRNKVCDTPGGWFCRGQYPPALANILAQGTDFNYKDKQYQTQHIDGIKKNASNQLEPMPQNTKDEDDTNARFAAILNSPNEMKDGIIGKEATGESIKQVSKIWENTPYSTEMWTIITKGTVDELESWLRVAPLMAHVRSSDGRGPMFWSFEYRRHDMVQILSKYGVGHSDRDKDGLTPVDLLDSQNMK
jgi:dolichyl-diphosphooligosaccharide--protein glycosyltransferase